MLKLLICGGGRYEEALFVASAQAADDTGPSDGRVHDGNDICELGLEDGVEVLRCALGNEGVAVCEGGEDADPVDTMLALISSTEGV